MIQANKFNESSVQKRAREWLNQIKRAGYRVTKPRLVVTRIIAQSPRALSAAEIYEQAKRDNPSIGLVSIYRTLDTLEELHIIKRVHQPDGCHTFIGAFHEHRHLLICTACGRAEYFEGHAREIKPLIQRVAEQTGFSVQDHWLQLSGLCSECRQASENP